MSPEQNRNSDTTGVLLVSCQDRPGLVAALAQLLYGHGANILDADQHTDREAGMFFQRIHFDLAQIHIDRLLLERAIDEVASRFEMTWRLHLCAEPKRVAIFVSFVIGLDVLRFPGHVVSSLCWSTGLAALSSRRAWRRQRC